MEESAAWWTAPIFMAVLKNALIGFGFLALLFLVIRPLLSILRSSGKRHMEGFAPLNQPEGELESESKLALAMYASSQQQLIEKVKQDPYQTAQILQNWLHQRD
jgi:flagellar M-ring protein FliF